MTTAVLDRPKVTGEIIAPEAGNPPILAVLVTSDIQRDGVGLDMSTVDLARYRQQGSLPLIDAHRSTDVPVGRVRNIETHLTGGIRECDCVKQSAGERGASPWSVRALPDHLVGELRFGSSNRAKELERLVREGTILDVSAGFDLKRRDKWSPITAWTPQEVSLVGRGMDQHTVIFQRSYRPQVEDPMPHPAYRRSTSEYQTRPYGAERDNDRPQRKPLTEFERAAMRSLLDRGEVYRQVIVEGYARSIQRRWEEQGRTPPAPWFPITGSATGFGRMASQPYARSADESFIHIIQGPPIPGDDW